MPAFHHMSMHKDDGYTVFLLSIVGSILHPSRVDEK